MDIVIFLLKYTPFWAIPSLMICIQFAYLYWLKNIRQTAYIFVACGLLNFFFLIFYYWAGGPEGVGKTLMRWSQGI